MTTDELRMEELERRVDDLEDQLRRAGEARDHQRQTNCSLERRVAMLERHRGRLERVVVVLAQTIGDYCGVDPIELVAAAERRVDAHEAGMELLSADVPVGTPAPEPPSELGNASEDVVDPHRLEEAHRAA